MKQKQLKAALERRAGDIQVAVQAIEQHGGEEDIHKFRIAYKKLRAFVRLVRTGHEEINSPLKSIKRLYRAAGAVRDLQLYRNEITPYFGKAQKEMPVFLTRLQGGIEDSTEAMYGAFAGFSFNKFLKEIDDFLPPEPDEKSVLEFAEEQAKGVNMNLANGSPSDEQLHAVRKHLKDIFYNARLFKKTEDINILHEENILKTTTALLGEHNDKRILLTLIKASVAEDIPEEEREILRIAAREQLKQKEALRAKIKNMLPGLL